MTRPTGPRQPLTTVGSWSQAAHIAWWWARTYSCLAERWAPLGYISSPGMWIVNMAFIGLHANNVVTRGRAAASIPDPTCRAKRRLLWSALFTPIAIFVALGLGLSSAVKPNAPRLWIGIVFLAGIWLIVLTAALLYEAWCALSRNNNGGGGNLKTFAQQLQDEAGRPAVIVSTLGAWPQRVGAGGPLLDDIRAELSAHAVIMVGLARDDELAAKYVSRFGANRIDPEHPLIVAWYPTTT